MNQWLGSRALATLLFGWLAPAGGGLERTELVFALDVRCVLRPGQQRFVLDMRWSGPADWLASAAMRAPK